MKECILNHVTDIYVWIIALFFLVLGIFIGKISKLGFKKVMKKIINELNDFILVATFFLALIMYVVEVFTDNLDNSKIFDILSFYVSFMFAWLLTQKSSKNEFEKQEKRLGKMAYKHIEQIWSNLGGVISDIDHTITEYKSKEALKDGIIIAELTGINNCLKYIRSSTEACVNDWNHIMDKDIIEKDNKQIIQQVKKDIDADVKNKFKNSNLGNMNNDAS